MAGVTKIVNCRYQAKATRDEAHVYVAGLLMLSLPVRGFSWIVVPVLASRFSNVETYA